MCHKGFFPEVRNSECGNDLCVETYSSTHWESFNYRLIEQGFAWYYNGGKECKNYKPLFETAQKEGYGLFDSEIGGFKEPKLWRKTRSND